MKAMGVDLGAYPPCLEITVQLVSQVVGTFAGLNSHNSMDRTFCCV